MRIRVKCRTELFRGGCPECGSDPLPSGLKVLLVAGAAFFVLCLVGVAKAAVFWRQAGV